MKLILAGISMMLLCSGHLYAESQKKSKAQIESEEFDAKQKKAKEEALKKEEKALAEKAAKVAAQSKAALGDGKKKK